MNKVEFLEQLRNSLNGLPREEVEERVAFYSEMIDDRIEEGLSEEEAVQEIGSVEDIASQVVGDIPLTKYIKEKITPKRKLDTWEIVLLIMGAPIWLSLLMGAVTVVFSIYVSLWAIIFAMWTVFGALIACGVSGVVAAIGHAIAGHGVTSMVMISGALTCTGLAIFLFFGCKAITKGIALLMKKFLVWIKRRFIKKEEM